MNLRRMRARPARPKPRSVREVGSGTVSTRAGSLLRRPTVPPAPVPQLATSALKKLLKRTSRIPQGVVNQFPFRIFVHAPTTEVSTLAKLSAWPLPPSVAGLVLLLIVVAQSPGPRMPLAKSSRARKVPVPNVAAAVAGRHGAPPARHAAGTV